MKNYYKVLTIAGSDSGGGAGIQADLKTFSALGCYGMSVITAITCQNTVEVTAVHPVPTEIIKKQMEAVLSDIGADAVKIGMLHSAEIIKVVAETLQQFNVRNVVLDTVMASKGGSKLLRDEAVDALKKYLIPISDVITPNIPEAEILLGRKINSIEEMSEAVVDLAKFGSKFVLLKGGHLESEESVDILYEAKTQVFNHMEFLKIDTKNSHGTGCTLASAIASYLATGLTVEESVFLAKTYIDMALDSGKDYVLGKGHGPVHHFYNFWSNPV
jgi:hydroxymethylpyrimidine/phosphomethylpyrimidine kinase